MARYAALLRAVNVGKRKVPMAELRELLANLGYEDVKTLLNSGNAVFDSSDSAVKISKDVEAALQKQYGFTVETVVRSISQLKKVLKLNPLGDVAGDDSMYLVCFLAGKPDAAVKKELEGTDFSPERLTIEGNELYAWCPNKINDSPMLKVVTKSKIAEHMTARNWRTVRKIAEL
ncbi:MAG: DUF1697 domain-containing protein [Solirubrobacterales bacterium]